MIKRIVYIILFFAAAFSSFAQENELAIAHTYFKQGEYDKAAEVYKKLSTEKNYAQLIHHDYVATLFKLRDYTTAEKFIKSQIAKYGNQVMYRADLADLYEQTGKIELSEKEYDKLINEAAGTDSKVYQMLNVLNRNRKIESMVKLILKDREVTKDPTKLDTWLVSAYSYLNQKDKMLEEALVFGIRNANGDYVKSIIQDNFITEEEMTFVESHLYNKIQTEPNEIFYPEVLIWWFAQKGDFGRVFVQARALDKRLNQQGFKMYELAGQAYTSKDYKNSARMYQFIMDEYPDGDLYPYARTLLIKSKEEIVKNTYPLEEESILDLIVQYKKIIADLGNNVKTAEAMRNMALLQGFYLHDYTSAIETLETAVASMQGDAKFRDRCKLDMGDIYMLKDEPWESTLLYMQVEKSQKEGELGESAKLKNAKLQYYTGQFSLAKDILDVLKKATSKEISNDAMQLSLLIEDNTGLDTSEVAMAKYAHADLLIFQNKYAEGLEALDSLLKEIPAHVLVDEILWLRANTLLKINRIDEAVKDLKKIIENHKDDILADDAIFTLAKVTEENLKDKTKAMEYYRKILTDYAGSIYNAQARVKFRELRGDYVN